MNDVLTGYAVSYGGYGVSFLELHKEGDTILVWENGNLRDDLEFALSDDSLVDFEEEFGPLYASLEDYRWAIAGGADPINIETWWLDA